MFSVTSRRGKITAALGVIGVCLLIALAYMLIVAVKPEKISAEATLQGVGPESLARDGVELRPAEDTDTSAFGQDGAIEFARKARPDKFQVLEVKLLHLVMTESDPQTDTLVWAVNLDPATVGTVVAAPPPVDPKTSNSAESGQSSAAFAVCFIDAKTGEQVFYAADYRIGDTPK